MDYTIHFSEVLPYLPLLLKGLLLAVVLTVLSTAGGVVLGLVAALVRIAGPKLPKTLADIYVETLRNTPLLVQMYLVYFGLGQFDIQIPPLTAAFVAMTLNTGAYQAVILEAGIKAVDVGQKEAAFALGLPFGLALRHVILPQAFRIVFAPLVSQAINLFLFSSVASTISVPELTNQTLYAESQTMRTFEVFAITTGLYFACTFVTTLAANLYERLRPATRA